MSPLSVNTIFKTSAVVRAIKFWKKRKRLSRIPTVPGVTLIKRNKEVIQVVNKAGKKQAQNKRKP